ncbi:MAG: response regulator [Xenococcaceae cyanobacterium MO_167.B27]|nr:response regulator [Xenococcaceae cyanobacterium MO_167.B27]
MSEIQAEKMPLILIVDDDRTMRSLLNLAMEEEGYRVVEAENGEQCLSEYTHFQPDLILLDAVMPDIDGFTCCQKIRRLPEGDRLPILMITVLDDRESVEQAFNAGATDYITKPIHWSVLSQRVRRLLDGDRVWTELTTVEEQLRQQRTWEKLISNILEQLVSGDRKSDSIKQVLSSIREWLQATRILMYQSDSQQYLESVAAGATSIKNFSATDFNLIAEYGEQYQQGKPIVIEDLSQADLPSAVIKQLKQSNTQTLSIVPIKKGHRLLGLLGIHFSGVFPQNQELLLNRLSDIGNILAIAIP